MLHINDYEMLPVFSLHVLITLLQGCLKHFLHNWNLTQLLPVAELSW